MKITNKLLLAGVALIASLSLASCAAVIGGNDMIKMGLNKATIEYENTDTESNKREFKMFNQKHSGAVCTIAIDTENSTYTSNNTTGVMGFGFGITKNENGTVNFGIASARYNKSTKKLQYYVSWMLNVSEADIDVGSNFVGLNGQNSKTVTNFAAASDPEQAYEIVVETTWCEVAAEPVEGIVTFVVDVKVDASNVYTVKLAKETEEVEGKVVAKSPFKTSTISTAVTGITYDKAKADDETTWYQADVSYYASVYTGVTLIGEWKVVDKQNNPIVAQ